MRENEEANRLFLSILTSRRDPALTLRHTIHSGRWSGHSAAGFTWPIGEQDLFVDAADVEFDPFLHGGVAAVRTLGDRWSKSAGSSWANSRPRMTDLRRL